MSTLEQNISARREAESLVDLAGEQSPRFWEVLAELAAAKLPPTPPPYDPFAPMNEQEAIRFEATAMPFGNYVGNEIGTLDCGYIGWLAENDFAIKLRRYVKSERFKVRQENEE
jgi:hypothetical protein